MEKRGDALRKHGPIACGRRDSPSGGICRSLSFVRLRQGPHSCPALAMELGEAQACLSASESKPTSPPGPGAVRSRRGAARRQEAGTQASCPAPVRAAAAPHANIRSQGVADPAAPSPGPGGAGRLQSHRGQDIGPEQRSPVPRSGLGPIGEFPQLQPHSLQLQMHQSPSVPSGGHCACCTSPPPDVHAACSPRPKALPNVTRGDHLATWPPPCPLLLSLPRFLSGHRSHPLRQHKIYSLVPVTA